MVSHFIKTYFVDEARNTFKKHVNALAIIKNQNNEKWLILKKKYMNNSVKENDETVENKAMEPQAVALNESLEPNDSISQPPYRPPPPLQLNQDFNILTNIIQDISVQTPKAVEIPESESKENLTLSEETPPKVHPRRKSIERTILEKRSSIPSLNNSPRMSIPNNSTEMTESPTLTSSRSECMLLESEQKISVKERKQMFNRMASESDVLKTQKLSFNTSVSVLAVLLYLLIRLKNLQFFFKYY